MERETNSDWQTGSIQNGRYVQQITGTGAWVRFVQPGPDGGFQAHMLVNLKPDVPGCAALISWSEPNGMWIDLRLFGTGKVAVTLYGSDGKPVKETQSGTAAFRAARDQLADVRHANGRASVWIDGVEAIAEFHAPFPALRLGLGLAERGIVECARAAQDYGNRRRRNAALDQAAQWVIPRAPNGLSSRVHAAIA